ncbi:MAG: PQQ-binding-like beta-propeller repeat protein [Chthoniobacteraceae bacterium]
MVFPPTLRVRKWTRAASLLLCACLSLAAESGAIAASAELIASKEKGWPQFRGPRRDGISDEKGLLQKWPDAGPKLLWSIEGIGQGFSSPVISGDRMFITGDVGEELHIFAFDLAGKKLWQAANGKFWQDPYPGSRASVAFSDGKVYSQNAHGRMACFDAGSGKEVWAVDLLESFGGKNITWALSECPLVVEKAVYATAGGSEALVVALDKKTGELIWKSAPLIVGEGDQAVESPSYVSPILVRFAGKRLLIGCSLRNLYCVDASNGQIQWTRPVPTTYNVLAMMPVLVGDSIFMTAPHGKPGGLFTLQAPKTPDGLVGFEEKWTTRLDTCQGGAIFTNGRIIGSYYGPRKGWAAVNPEDGKVLYSAPEIIKGAVVAAEDRVYVLAEDGWMHLLEAGDASFVSHGKFRFVDAGRRDAWAHPVILDGRLYLRYHDKLACYDIRKSES